MCDPVTLTAAALTAAGTGANYVAGNNAAKSAQNTMNANTAVQGAQFDRRTGYVNDSNKRVMDLTQGQYGDTSALEDKLFSYMLDQSKTRADTQDLAQKGLVTAQKQVNDQRVADTAAETGRQIGYQDDIQKLVMSLPGLTGFAAQSDAAGNSFANRMSTMATALNGGAGAGAGPTPLADDLVQRTFADRQAGALSAVQPAAIAGARIGAAHDAASFADQLAGQVGTQADLVKSRSGRSQDQTNQQLSVRDQQAQLAADHAAFAMKLAQDAEQMRGSAESTWGTNQQNTLNSYYGNSLGSEQSFTQGLVGNSQNYENQMTTAANYKIANTKADTTFGDLLKQGGSLVAGMGQAATGPASWGQLTPMTAMSPEIIARAPVVTNVPGLTTMPQFSFGR